MSATVRSTLRRFLGLALGGGIALAACGDAPASSAAAGTPAPDSPVVVTFRVGEVEQFRVRLVDPADVAVARALLTGQAAGIPNGRLVRSESDVNTGHPWSLDPFDFAFADFTTEVCDGLPSMVDTAAFAADRYCPWSAKVVGIEPAPRP